MKKLLCFLTVLSLLGMLPCTVLAQEAPTVVSIALWHTPDLDGKWELTNEVKLLKEKYNIELKYQYYDTDQFSLLMAGGELPDIVTCSNNYIATVVDNNMALDLDPLLAEYCPNLNLDIYTASNELSRQLMGGKNKQLFFLAPGIGPESLNASDASSWGYGVRWDLYKQLGCPAIDSNEDYINVIKQMLKLYPTNANGEEVFGIGTCDLFARWYQFGCMSVDGGALNPWVFGGSMYMSGWEDCVLYNGYTNTDRSAYWTAMKFFNRAYNEGLLDPDSFIMTRPELQAKMAAGRYVAAIPYEGNQLYTEMLKDDPNTMAGIARIQSKNTFIFADKLALTGNMPSDNIFVNAKSKNQEAALKVIDFFHDPDVIRMSYSGVKGVDWDYDTDGVPYVTEKALNDLTTYSDGTEEYLKATGIRGLITEWTPFQATGIHPDGYPYQVRQQFKYRAMTLNPLQKDFSDHYGFSCPSEYQMSFVKNGTTFSLVNDYGQMVAAGISEIPMDIKRIMDACSDIAYRAVPELVMAKDEQEYKAVQERVMQELAAADEATAWTWCEKVFNDVKAKMSPIFVEAQKAFQANQK